jgi:hypothetical protein
VCATAGGDGATYALSIAGTGEDLGATGDLDITRTVAVNGRSTIAGAGLDRVVDVRAGTLVLDGPTITGGELGAYDPAGDPRGAGIRVAPGAQLVALDSVVEGNHAWHGGGGISGQGNVTLDHSVVRGNTSDGGYLDMDENITPGNGAGINMEAGRLTVTDSTVSGNTIAYGVDGSAIHGSGSASVALVRSTVERNHGGQNAVIAPSLTITTSTVSGNTTAAAIAGANVTITGSTILHAGGFAVRRTGSVTTSGSILAATASAACSAPLTTGGFNIADDASCGLTGTGDRPSTDPFLGPLTDNGGPTATHLPFDASAALDAIPAGTAPLCDGSNPTDQRGTTRPVGSACDIGAVEGSSSSTALPLSLLVDDAGPAHDVVPGDGLCTTAGGGCTLSAAVDETNAWPPADTITIAPGTNPVVAAGDRLLVVDDLDLHGNGAVVSGGGDHDDRVLLTVDGPAVSIERTTLTGPARTRVVRGSVTLTEATLDGSSVQVDAGADLSVVRSTVFGRVRGNGHALIDRSTVVATAGAAIETQGFGVAGSGVEIRSSTIVGPSVGVTGPPPLFPGAIRRSGIDIPISVRGSVIVGGAGPACERLAQAVSFGHNVVSDSSCEFGGALDRQGATPTVLGAADNGGPTPTRLLYANSPAIDAIPAGTAGLCDGSVPTDQRGQPRQLGAACDAGAVEGAAAVAATAPITLVVDRAADGRDLHPGDGACLSTAGGCTLRASIDEANAWPFADDITVAPGVAPQLSIPGTTEDLNRTGDLDISGPVTITGTGSVIDAGHLDRALDHHAGAVTLRTLRVQGGIQVDYDGGAIRSKAALTLRSTIVTGNDSDGIVAKDGALTVSSSSIVDNAGVGLVAEAPAQVDQSTVARNGGAGIVTYGPATITRTTVSGNAGGAIAVGSDGADTTTITASTLTGSSDRTLLVGSGARAAIVATAITTTDPTGTACGNALLSASYSRMTDASCLAPGAGNAVVPSLGLGPLASNGGPTATHLPSATSALLDVVPAGTGSCTGALPLDQRRLPRPSGAACDVGAVERQP